jgi:hypothetical protein
MTGTEIEPPDAGVPLRRPVEESESPPRFALGPAEKVYGGTPPVAAIWFEHSAFGTQAGKVVGVANESVDPVPTSSL